MYRIQCTINSVLNIVFFCFISIFRNWLVCMWAYLTYIFLLSPLGRLNWRERSNLSNSVSFISRVGADYRGYQLVLSCHFTVSIKLRSQHSRCESPRRPSWEVLRGARARWSLPCRRRAGAGIPAGRPAAESSPRHCHWYRYWSSPRGLSSR